ncbi:hypothetical protein E8E12_009744 [Didymella heteroderae]|uniref:RING-type domain-containing protein n=1 Tax=Didymella heteroderae TaxID=1769908 RepID=A0A9P4WY29_9PLEO|nr:hypothetical protein E8E12_009744 [Didymella heteroderae]
MSMPTFSKAYKDAYELFIRELRRFHITNVEYISEEKCIVCMEKLCDVDSCQRQEHEEPARLICGHVIGMNCAESWFFSSQQCPMCRAQVWGTPAPEGDYWF